MSLQIKLHLQNRTKHPVDKEPLEEIARKNLQELSLAGIVELNVTISGNDYIHKLNRRYRNIDRPTDVLSFPIVPFRRGKFPIKFAPSSLDIPLQLGDIVIAYPVAESQAMEHGHSTGTEINLLFEHGLKHLLGFHHKE